MTVYSDCAFVSLCKWRSFSSSSLPGDHGNGSDISEALRNTTWEGSSQSSRKTQAISLISPQQCCTPLHPLPLLPLQLSIPSSEHVQLTPFSPENQEKQAYTRCHVQLSSQKTVIWDKSQRLWRRTVSSAGKWQHSKAFNCNEDKE